MKRKDIATIVVIAIVSAVVAFTLSKLFFGTTGDKAQRAEVVDAVSTEFKQPDPRYFNANAVNPTQMIRIGSTNNQNPFGSAQ